MTPICRICNHEHGLSDPHVFDEPFIAIKTPDKGTVYAVAFRDAYTTSINVPLQKPKRKKGKAESPDETLKRIRRQRAASMRRYRAKLKARKNEHD